MKFMPQTTSTQPGHRPSSRGSLRKIRLGMVVGGILAGTLAVLAERREEQTESETTRVIRARPYTGPAHGTVAANPTGGGPWLGLRGLTSPAIKPSSRLA